MVKATSNFKETLGGQQKEKRAESTRETIRTEQRTQENSTDYENKKTKKKKKGNEQKNKSCTMTPIPERVNAAAANKKLPELQGQKTPTG